MARLFTELFKLITIEFPPSIPHTVETWKPRLVHMVVSSTSMPYSGSAGWGTGRGSTPRPAGKAYVVGGDGVDHVVDVADVAKQNLAVALLVVAGGDDVVGVAEPRHVRSTRALMALIECILDHKAYRPGTHSGHCTRVPDGVLSVLETCTEKRTCEVPFHLLELRTDQIERDDFLLR